MGKMKMTRSELKRAVEDVLPEAVQLRHDLHRIPEIAGSEKATRELLEKHARELGVLFWRPKLGTDLVFEIPGRDPGRVIGLRADMDGLPIEERSQLPYASRNKGMMHACGHDGHMAVLMATAKVLAGFQERLPCTVRFIFQPGEEIACLGAELVEKGVCDGLEAVYALHNWPGLAAGLISSKPGILFAAANTFSLKVRGTGTHGATPENGRSPLVPAASLVTRLQQLHEATPGGVVSVCMVQGGQNTNVIPSETIVAGTTRYTDETVGDRIEAAVRALAADIEQEYSVTVDVLYERTYHLPVINSEEHVHLLQETADSMLGDGAYLEASGHAMTAEDFAFYLREVPGCMFWLGAGMEAAPLHAETFDFNDEIIGRGILAFTSLVFSGVLSD